MRRTVVRVITVAGMATAAVVFGASAAAAHTEVELDKPRAGAADVTMTMTAEAESDSAGIASVRVVLPAGITASQITVVSAPAGWRLTEVADGYTIAGKALPTGADARAVTRIAQLPPAAVRLVFKTLVTYGDGRVDRWIEEPSAAAPSPDNPAPIVTLSPAPAIAKTPQPTTPAAATPAPAATATAGQANGGGSASSIGWLIVAVAGVAAAALASVLILRR